MCSEECTGFTPEYDPVFGLALVSLGQTDVRPVLHPLIGPMIARLLERGTMAIRLMNRPSVQVPVS